MGDYNWFSLSPCFLTLQSPTWIKACLRREAPLGFCELKEFYAKSCSKVSSNWFKLCFICLWIVVGYYIFFPINFLERISEFNENASWIMCSWGHVNNRHSFIQLHYTVTYSYTEPCNYRNGILVPEQSNHLSVKATTLQDCFVLCSMWFFYRISYHCETIIDDF